MAGNTGSGATNDSIEFFIIQTKGNGQDFGEMITVVDDGGACCDKTRGVAACALSNTVTMEFITMATFGNASDFGDLTSGRRPRGCSSKTRGVFAAGDPIVNIMDYITIQSTGDATDFGDLITPVQQNIGLSDSHGGLG